jgi:hypothetical protein
MSAATTTRVVRFLGLSDLTETVAGLPAFPLGVLYPYSSDLQRVCTNGAAMCEEYPEITSMLLGERDGATVSVPVDEPTVVTDFMTSINALYNRIAFAPGPAGGNVALAFQQATRALVPQTHHHR